MWTARWVFHLPGEESVMLRVRFCREPLGPEVHVDLACITYLNIDAHQVQPFMETVFPNHSGLFQQDCLIYGGPVLHLI